ncbi:MAG: hypothetical protein JW954_02820 [Dehalococcoidaceae bacterium]|nr:hypothetical protein [Dehalococcoidaceae bacterium]
MRPAAITACLILLVAGLIQAVVIPVTGNDNVPIQNEDSTFTELTEAFKNVFAYNDATALTHQAADNFNNGLNPYRESNIIKAMLRFDGSSDKLTPLRKGVFEDDFPYPALEKIEAYWQDITLTPEITPEAVMSYYGYPAGSFIIPSMFIRAGIEDIRLVFLILTVLALGFVVRFTPSNRRLLLVLAVLSSLELANSIAAGETGFLYFPLMLLGWVLIKKKWWLSALFVGMSLAVKQVTWFILPFYLILTWRTAGFSRLRWSAFISLATFFSFNIVYIIDDPGLWVSSILSPMSRDMFPLGVGFITLVTGGLLKIDAPQIFALVECCVWLGCIAWYLFNASKYPLAGPVLGVLPLFFAWRSLWPYFFYVDIIIFGCVLIWTTNGNKVINRELQQC